MFARGLPAWVKKMRRNKKSLEYVSRTYFVLCIIFRNPGEFRFKYSEELSGSRLAALL